MEKITSINYEKVMGSMEEVRKIRNAGKSVELIDTLIGTSSIQSYSLDFLISLWLHLRESGGNIDYTSQFLNYLAKKEGRKVVSIEEDDPVKKRTGKKRC